MFGSIYPLIRECKKHGWTQSSHSDTCCQQCMREQWAEEAESPAGYDFGELREDIDELIAGNDILVIGENAHKIFKQVQTELLAEEEWTPSQSDYGHTT